MPVTIELPPPVDEELTQEARREGVRVEERTALLVILATALGEEGVATPFRDAVRSFLEFYSLDAERVASAFQELCRVCLSAHDEGKRLSAFQRTSMMSAVDTRVLALLSDWRNAIVHGTDISADGLGRHVSPAESMLQDAGRSHREGGSDVNAAADCEVTQALPPDDGAAQRDPSTPEAIAAEAEANAASIALLQSWLAEDATDDPEEIRKAQQELDAFKRAINAERDRAGARRVYP